MAQRFVLPVEALSSLGVIGLLAVGTTFALSQWQQFQNYGKAKRFNVDKWDRAMMERDSRLSGNVNRQRFEAAAPESFKTNSAWVLEKPTVQ
ncbi:hypothetical protein BC830DRAFT_1171312 [Chytriomyces sp. MP71]|nr:hypothetical protein BC830DRAFT_1174217 [Chytriomyces sp. MP71]KAI8612152.1 hypothetical protein BC830DRAFT_1171312 [Chytriomyces sp. MP71]